MISKYIQRYKTILIANIWSGLNIIQFVPATYLLPEFISVYTCIWSNVSPIFVHFSLQLNYTEPQSC